MRKFLRKVEPTPKLYAALGAGLLAMAAIWLAEQYGLADVRASAAGLLVLVLSTVGAWLKSDASSPEPDDHGVEL